MKKLNASTIKKNKSRSSPTARFMDSCSFENNSTGNGNFWFGIWPPSITRRKPFLNDLNDIERMKVSRPFWRKKTRERVDKELHRLICVPLLFLHHYKSTDFLLVQRRGLDVKCVLHRPLRSCASIPRKFSLNFQISDVLSFPLTVRGSPRIVPQTSIDQTELVNFEGGFAPLTLAEGSYRSRQSKSAPQN